MKDDLTLRDVLDAVNAGFTALEQKMATKEELTSGLDSLRKDMQNGFTEVHRKIDTLVEPRLDDHVRRIKKLEEEVFHS